MHDELAALIGAAGGRTLALFTSYRAMQAAADALRHRLATDILMQIDLPKPVLVNRFTRGVGHLAVRHHGLLAGHRRARAARWRWWPSTACRSPDPTSRCCRRGASGPGPTPSAWSTCPARPRCWPRAPVG